jgi:hypothetical protein
MRTFIEKEPDWRVQVAIELVFKKFAELQSARQVHRWLRQESITLPTTAYGSVGPIFLSRLQTYSRVLALLPNPVYAGAYSYGRTTLRVQLEQGHKRIVR